MKRLLIVLLLAIVPLQAVWASAARYCAHEPATPSHFGHHEHEHVAPQAAPTPDLGGGESDLDCSVCHLACCASIPVSAGMSMSVLRAPMSEHARADFRSHATSVPLRPDIPAPFVAA